MLSELRISGLVLAEDLVIEPGAGLNLITGETGSGKTLLVEALGVIAGSRAEAGRVRSGARAARIEAVFLNLPAAVAAAAREAGADVEDGRLLAAREVAPDGRSRAWLDGKSVAAGVLKAVIGPLIDLHGQHRSLLLTRAGAYRDALDRHAALDAAGCATAEAAIAVRASRRRLSELAEALGSRGEKRERIADDLRRIDTVAPRAGEEAALREEHAALAHAARLGELAWSARAALADDEDAALPRIARAESAVDQIAALLPSVAPAAVNLREARLLLTEALERLPAPEAETADPGRLDALSERLSRLEALRRRFDRDEEGLVALRDELAAQLALLEDGGAALAEAGKSVAAREAAYRAAAGALSNARVKAAPRLAAGISRELEDLALPPGAVRVSVRPQPDRPEGGLTVAAEGWDEIEILFQPNPGEPPRPLTAIASGGELSRLMLAFDLLAGRDGAPTVLFDEIDAGVGGRAAGALGERLRKLSRDRQVLCVTHQPQIAALADHHWRVDKAVRGGRTAMRVERLDRDGRVQELTRMLSGDRGRSEAARHALALLDESRRSDRPRSRRTA